MVSWLDAQTSVLGSVLIEPKLAPKLLAMTTDADYSGEHRTVFQAIAALVVEGSPIDATMVQNKLGSAYNQFLTELIYSTPTSANFDAYVEIVKEQSRLTALHGLSMELGSTLSLDEAREVLSKAQTVATAADSNRIFPMMQMLGGFFTNHQDTKTEFIKWGISGVDDKLYVDRGDVVVIGGYPSDGKSALMLQTAFYMSKKYRVGIFSYETSQQKLTDRLIAHTMGLSLESIKHNRLCREDWQRISFCADSFTKQKIEVIEAAGMTTNDILGITLSRGYDVIFIDYVQLVSPGANQRNGTRSEEVAEISRSLHVMAQRHNVLVVELSQLSRPEKRVDGKIAAPTLASLRESGQLEQDADVVMLLFRTDPATPDSTRCLYIAKNKDGELGMIPLEFDGPTQTFSRAYEPVSQQYSQ